MTRFRRFLITLLLAGQTFAVLAIEPQSIPEALKVWEPWVLADQPQFNCPFFYQDFAQKHCSWAGPLTLDLHERQGKFNGEWTLYQADWIVLPGDNQHWPQQVAINQKPAVVVDYQGKPAVRMPAGHYLLSGQFNWDKPPENLALPADTGLIQLTLNDQRILYPRIDQGALWLNAPVSAKTDSQQDSLDLQVYRQIIDDNPLQVITRLELNVSGTAREINLPHAMLPDFIPVRLDSPLPARIESNGLRVQVRPGHWLIDLQARHPQALTQLDFAIETADWPEAELWAFQAMPALRLVEIEAVPGVDPSQTNLPPEWRHLPTYQIKQGQSMKFKVLRQGDPEPEPNQLSLHRKLWLDFDGAGYTVSDQINGKMSRDWRLNALPETELGQVLLNSQNQLITQLNEQQHGIEVRRGAIQLQADSRIQNDIGTLNAVGWQQSFQNVQAELNIPPGWRLLAVTGVDNDPDSWLTRWTLLDLFLVLIIAMAMSRLWCWQWGLLALCSLALFWHEAEAPRWIWLNTLAALALFKVLPDNRFSLWVKWYRNLCWLGLVLIVIPFMIEQIRIGLYPQLERPWQAIEAPMPYATSLAGNDEMAEGVAMEAPAPASAAPKMLRQMSKAYASVADYASSATHFDRIDPDANLQTGPGLPQWQWQTVQLSWNGVVDSQQSIELWYLSPAWSLLLHVLQALLAAVMSLKLLGLLSNYRINLPLPSLSVWLLLPFLLTPADDSFADMPEQALLDQLKARLLEAPKCLPSCAQIPSMTVNIKPDSMQLQLAVHTQEAVAVPLPAQLQQWFPEQITVNGQVAQTLLRQDDGSLWLSLPAGVHQVLLQGRHSPQYKFTLPLPLQPQQTQVNSDGWRVDGVYENGKVGPQLEFSRLNATPSESSKDLPQASLPAFVRVERTLQLGLDWRLHTRVVKLANDSPVVLELPLLAGEAVTSSHMRIKDGKLLINVPAGQTSLEWESLLEKNQHIELKAADNPVWSELWRADVSPIWHLQTSGIAVVHHQDQQGVWLPEWRPWPGESVTLHITRPQAVPGATLTIDKSELRLQPGKRSQLADLTLSLRSSKGGQHSIRLPEQAVLQNVSIDGVSQPIRQKDQTVTLPVRPGAQQINLNWQTPSEQAPILHTPSVDLGISSVNSHINVRSGEDRWVLFTFGPRFGPAALIWGLLAVLLLLAFGLGKTAITPLKSWHWLLLLLGLSQIHLAAGLLVVIWLFALGLRGKTNPDSHPHFNLGQVVLGMLTLTAILLLFAAVQQGLLGTPDMQITGNQSSAQNLNWYQDKSAASLPSATVISVPMMSYRILMLGWSLWMALALLNWLRWGWGCFVSGGIWKQTLKSPNTPKESSDS